MIQEPHPCGAAVVSLAALFTAQHAVAESAALRPNAPIRLVVPYPPGGATDLTARLVGQKMGALLGRTFVVDNRPGANGILGTNLVAKAPADGHTMLLAPREVLGINPWIYASLPYDPLKDFACLGILTEGPYVLVAEPKLRAKTVEELLRLARSRPLTYGSFGIGSMAHLNLESFGQRMGIRWTHVPYKGSAAAIGAVAGGEVSVSITTPPAAIAFLGSGKINLLAVGARKRLALLPDVPTLAEAGAPADALVPGYFGTAVPAKTPKSVVAELNNALKRALAAPEVTERLTASGLVPVGSSPEEMTTTVSQDLATFGKLVKAIGIKPQ
jgi:tripartite-type tricarboxylate transporter receptor subunit TctC